MACTKKIACFFLIKMAFLEALMAEEYIVDWTTGVDYEAWANTHTFRQGDTLRFVYQGDKGVEQVTRKEFGRCKTDFPMRNAGGNTSDQYTIINLDHSKEYYYFISVIPKMCEKGMKLQIWVSPPYHPHTHHSDGTPSPLSFYTLLALPIFVSYNMIFEHHIIN